MNFSITPKPGGMCEVCVDGHCHIEPCIDTSIQILEGKLVLAFSKQLAEKILDSSAKNGSLAFDHIDRTQLV